MKSINKIIICLSVGVVCFCAMPCVAADTDTINTVSDDGETIIMQSGQVYESDDPSTSGSWQPGDAVVITGDKIIDTDQGGESVEGSQE